MSEDHDAIIAVEKRAFNLREQDRAIKAIRWACVRSGYALAVHGTRRRDLDLLAVPWSDDSETVGRLLKRIVEAGFIHSKPEKKPHGRIAYVVHRSGEYREMGCDYIDLSIMPRQRTQARR